MTRRILIIDDEDDIRELLQTSLEISTDWTILTVASGQAGLDLARHQPIDAIILDMMMPGMDGLTTLEKLQADPATQEIPVVFLTAKTQTTGSHQYQTLGAKAVLSKLIEPLKFGDQLAEILGWSEA
ncbi:MAG: response regulator [Oscillatoriales cyanobacterium RM1_1_9]|nr:response regulator [Oscillatoriales cyanobacterium SM2_3_0]NJO44647.1 response regulator [Oscillatoriales cyanobacterium RM2_1_1]NJO71598.1 response regulator [Oscillatoriales cyanobacterium RM1_1_9]